MSDAKFAFSQIPKTFTHLSASPETCHTFCQPSVRGNPHMTDDWERQQLDSGTAQNKQVEW